MTPSPRPPLVGEGVISLTRFTPIHKNLIYLQANASRRVGQRTIGKADEFFIGRINAHRAGSWNDEPSRFYTSRKVIVEDFFFYVFNRLLRDKISMVVIGGVSTLRISCDSFNCIFGKIEISGTIGRVAFGKSKSTSSAIVNALS